MIGEDSKAGKGVEMLYSGEKKKRKAFRMLLCEITGKEKLEAEDFHD